MCVVQQLAVNCRCIAGIVSAVRNSE